MEDRECRKREETAPLVTTEEIREILEKYAIGKKPLSALLGWGETTVLRYAEGDMPTKEYSDRLRALLENPVSYFELLLGNQDKITHVAFEKSKRAVMGQIYRCKLMRIGQAVIDEAGEDFGYGSLQFLCYYVQVCHLAFYGEPAFEEEFDTKINFCPYPCLWEMQDWHYRLAGWLPCDLCLTQREYQLVREVVFAFRWYGPETMRGIMGLERNWLKVTKNQQGATVISHQTLKSYFDKVFQELGINAPKDFGKYIFQKALEVIHE